jgi:hypothetical protein
MSVVPGKQSLNAFIAVALVDKNKADDEPCRMQMLPALVTDVFMISLNMMASSIDAC